MVEKLVHSCAPCNTVILYILTGALWLNPLRFSLSFPSFSPLITGHYMMRLLHSFLPISVTATCCVFLGSGKLREVNKVK